jgi:hypothetical protein
MLPKPLISSGSTLNFLFTNGDKINRFLSGLFALMMVFTFSSCAPTIVETEMFGEPRLIPPLENPEGSESLGGGGGGGPGSQGSGNSFTSLLNLDDVSTHFASQLKAAGWNELERQDSEDQTTIFYDLLDEEGRNWTGSLTIILQDAQAYNKYKMDVNISVVY